MTPGARRATTNEFDRLITTLPHELEDAPAHEARMGALLEELARRPVPTSRIARLWALGSTQMSVVATTLLARARGALSSEEKRVVLRNEARIRSAFKVLRTMGYLRGAVAKLGQTIAAYPNMATAELGEILGALNFQAPPMHASLIREQIASELGDDPENLFAWFEPEACAAASLGQVHRARLKTGEEVAVKVQYPNIARTIAADLANLKALMTPLRVTREWKHLAAQLADIAETFERETDYEREARYTDLARRHLADIEDIRVPRVHEAFSSRRVLTTEWLDGVHLDGLLARHASPEVRNRHGAQVFRAMCRLFYSGEMIHADPNPGNYLFLDDGRLGLIDFGCCRVFDEEERDFFNKGTRDWLELGTPSDELIQRGALLDDEEMKDAERVAMLRASVDWLWEPLRTEGAFHFDDDFMRRGIGHLKDIMDHRYTRTTPINTWTNRMFYGVRVLMNRLDARIEARAIHEEEIRRR